MKRPIGEQMKTKKSQTGKTNELITLRDAAALIMNPDNPEASYGEIDRQVDETAKWIMRYYRTSYGAAGMVVVIALMSVVYYAFWDNEINWHYSVFSMGIAAVISLFFFPPIIGRAFYGRWIVPKPNPQMKDLMNRLARGEFDAKWGDDNTIMVNINDINAVIEEQKDPYYQYVSRRPARSMAMNLKLKNMPVDANCVDPKSLEELASCASGDYVSINTIYAFILGNGDRIEGEKLLRKYEREGDMIIRQPNSQCIQVGSARKQLKGQGILSAGGSPWDGV